MSEHFRQPQSDRREQHKQQEMDEIAREERQHALEDALDGYVSSHALDDVEVHAEWRMDEADLHRARDKDAEPDGRHPGIRDDRQQDRSGQQHQRKTIEDGAEDQQKHSDKQQRTEWAETKARNQVA